MIRRILVHVRLYIKGNGKQERKKDTNKKEKNQKGRKGSKGLKQEGLKNKEGAGRTNLESKVGRSGAKFEQTPVDPTCGLSTSYGTRAIFLHFSTTSIISKSAYSCVISVPISSYLLNDHKSSNFEIEAMGSSGCTTQSSGSVNRTGALAPEPPSAPQRSLCFFLMQPDCLIFI